MSTVEHSSMELRTFRRLAVLARPHLYAGILLILITEFLALLAGIFFNADQSHIISSRYLFLAILCLIAAIAGNLFVLRLIIKILVPIEHVEKALIELAESRDYGRVHLQVAGLEESDSLVQACNLLINKLESAENQQLEFINKFAHDLRSPLATMMGYAELLGDPGYRTSEEFLEKSSLVIKKQGNQVCQLIDDVLNTVKAETNLSHTKMSAFHLSQLLDEILLEIRQRTGRDIFFENQAGDALIIGDALGLREVLIHMIDNGLKYSGPDQPVYVGLQSGKSPGFVEISVRDHGIGIDEAQLARLFQRFSRIKNDSTSEIPGTGLGLYIVKNIIKQHKGDVSVESRLGQGTTFTISLPVGLGNYGGQ